MKKLGTVVAGVAKAILPNVDWSNVSVSTYVRWIIAILTMVNNVLIACGIQPFDIKEDMIYALVSAIMNIVVIILNTYKDNPTSKEAIIANSLMKSLKNMDEGQDKDDTIQLVQQITDGNIKLTPDSPTSVEESDAEESSPPDESS